MKKFLVNFILLIFILIVVSIAVLSTIGIETKRFNNLIIDKASQSKNINLELKTISFKINPKELSLFLETRDPKIIYKNITVPAESVKVYVDFLSLLKSETKITKTNVILKELDIIQLKKLSTIIKPSNFRSLLNNRIREGQLVSEIDIFLNKEGLLKEFIAKGKVSNLKAQLFNGVNLQNTNFSFFADNKDVLIKNIFGRIEDIKISDGDIKLNLNDGLKLNSNFNSKINFNEKIVNKYYSFFKKNKFFESVKEIDADLNNNLYIDFDDTYKVRDYNYSISGKLNKSKLKLTKSLKNNIIGEIKEIYFKNLQFQSSFSPKKTSINGDGKYSFNNSNFLKINFKNDLINNILNLKLEFDYQEQFNLDLINYKKPKNAIANLSLDYEKYKNKIKINKFNFKEGDDKIIVNNLIFNNDKFSSFKKIEIITSNNNFYIQNKKTILIKGSKFDATNLPKFFNTQNTTNKFENINNKIEIDFADIKVPMSEKLKNFKLIGEIKKGKFVKITSKGDFGGNNYLDISMKKDQNSNRKYLEIYSDLTRPLLTEYNFFNGLSGGKLLFTSVIDGSKSNSKLKIENFKVINAPGVIKLLSLADLGGLADLAEGEGLSFDVLEIDMEKNKNFLKLNEILALGPSISVLMEGYQDENGITSLKGTLVPAKTLNKMISKIPVIGNIVIPKEAGEGLFGVSFKMKGPKGKIKTIINPIRTLTPRFIQKIIDKNKETK